MSDVVKKQTIKQAKASFKARGRPTLSEKESRQLERAIELEKRADRAKEAEKRRLEAARKRTEKERRDHANKQAVQLGTQRRCDRFGYKSSQFHLGAFFGKRPAPKPAVAAMAEIHAQECSDDDMDDDLDDASLLGALGGPGETGIMPKPVLPQQNTLTDLMPPPPVPVTSRSNPMAMTAPHAQEDFSDFFDSLDSGTQIARALDNPKEHRAVDVTSAACSTTRPSPIMLPPPRPHNVDRSTSSPSVHEDLSDFFGDLESGTQIARELDQVPGKVRRASNASGSSFGSGSLDLTEEDMEMIDPPKSWAALSPSLATTASWPKSAEGSPTTSALGPRTFPVLPAKVTSMPPPAKRSPPVLVAPIRTSRRPPTNTAERPQAKLTNIVQRTDMPAKQQMSAIRGPFRPASSLYCSPELGFSSTQLESFIDDDLQLTQVG